jgi:hypothetical protein
MSDPELLDEKIICRCGHFVRVRRWWRGAHPALGAIIRGLTGWETVEERDCIRPQNQLFNVVGAGKAL